jgi:hypothetical protein
MGDITRRTAFGLGAVALAGSAGLITAGTATADETGAEATKCVPTSTLVQHGAVGGATLYYDDGSPSPAGGLFNENFHSRLVNWRLFYNNNNPWSLLSGIYHLGVLRPGDDDSWHCAGRALDISRGFGTDAGNATQFSARYDQWKTTTGDTRMFYERRYWAAAASLHYFFRDTLTYRFNTAHHNHIHVDNGQNGINLTTFSTGSGTQVESVQAMLHFIWGYSDRQTTWSESVDGARCAAVLARIGYGGRITTGQRYWLAFLQATLRRGSGLQTY